MSDKNDISGVHQPCTPEDIRCITKDFNLNYSPGVIDALTDKTTESFQSLRILDSLEDFKPEVKYPRTSGHKPKQQDSCGNAWCWRCDIRGAPSGRLLGKTLAVKDNCSVAGVPMSVGSRVMEGYTPEFDATVVTRILDNGGRILGKSSCDDMCRGSLGLSGTDGMIYLPRASHLCVGGSSGGSAVLVASGEVDMAIGTDQGGSIRTPAAWTGTVGLKPTHGLVPYTGIVSLDPILDHVGPITKNVYDCALLLEVLAGYDGLDSRQRQEYKVPEYSKLLDISVQGKTLGVLKEGFAICAEGTQQVVRQFLTTVSAAGLKTRDVSVPLHSHGGAIRYGLECPMLDGAMGIHTKGWYSTSLETALRQNMATRAPLLGLYAASLTVRGELVRRRHGNYYYTKARNLTLTLNQQYDAALDLCDVIIMPTLPYPAPSTDSLMNTSLNKHRGALDAPPQTNQNLMPTNLTGHPALTLPLGRLGDGTSDSVMIVGRKYDEVTVLQVARALEKLIPARQD